jgi:hypothetical protein
MRHIVKADFYVHEYLSGNKEVNEKYCPAAYLMIERIANML